MKITIEWRIIGTENNSEKDIFKERFNLTKVEFEHLQKMDLVCRNRKYSIGDLFKTIFTNLDEETIEEILFREDTNGTYPIEI